MNSLKTIFMAMLAVGLSLSSCHFNVDINSTEASKNYITRNYRVSNFDIIDISTVGDVYFIQSTDGSVSVQAYGPDNVINAINVSKSESTLSMHMEKGKRFNGKIKTKITISTPDLRKINFKGVGNIHIEDGLNADEFIVFNHGVGDVNIKQLKCNTLKVNATGVGNVNIDGEASYASLDSNGVGNIQASNLRCEKVKAFSRGVGNISCYATESISATATGIGNITYKGSPSHKEISKSGVGSIKEK